MKKNKDMNGEIYILNRVISDDIYIVVKNNTEYERRVHIALFDDLENIVYNSFILIKPHRRTFIELNMDFIDDKFRHNEIFTIRVNVNGYFRYFRINYWFKQKNNLKI